MKKPPAFQVYARDWLSEETVGLSFTAKGAYMDLLSLQWLEVPLPNNVAGLARILKTTVPTLRPIWREIKHLFPLVAGDARHRANPGQEAKRQETEGYRRRQTELALRRWRPKRA
jgi:hypothetical protein